MIDQLKGNRFLICINNEGNEPSLEQWKVYKCIQDAEAEKHNEVRVIDEEGEGYLYPANCFSPVQLDSTVAETFLTQQSTPQ